MASAIYIKKKYTKPRVRIDLPREVFRDCVLSALESDDGTLPIIPEILIRCRDAMRGEQARKVK